MELSEADAAVNEASVNPAGTLRVTASVSFASIYIAPALPEFHRRYPNLNVQIVAANRYPDFIEAGIDVAIRTREHEADSGITVRKLAETRRVLAASPGYLAKHGAPATPDARPPAAGVQPRERSVRPAFPPRREEAVGHDQERARCERRAGDPRRGACRAGILIQPLYIVHDDIVGKLVPVLTDWQLPALTVNIAYQSRRHQPAKIRVFTEFLIERVERLGLARKWKEVGR